MTILKREIDTLPANGFAASQTSNEFSRIVLAFLLRDMRTRFGRSYVSYFISIGWPLVHLLFMFGAYVVTHKIAPIGDDPSIFVFTGISPYILCLYPARFTAMAVVQNRPLLLFPITSPTHLILARIILEALSALIVFLLFVLFVTAIGGATLPDDNYLAANVIFATLYFAIGLGVFGLVAVSFHHLIAVLTMVFLIVGLYLSSGAIVPLNSASESVRNILWYNPLYQSVSLLRCAYYGGLSAGDYSISYIYLLGSGFLCAGFLGERLFRGRVLTSG